MTALVVAAALATVVGGCAADSAPVAADDAVFEGLDRAVVDEALALKGDVIAAAPDEERASTAQQIALEVAVCRAAYAHLGAWPEDGAPPGALELPRLTARAVEAGALPPVDRGDGGSPAPRIPWDAMQAQLLGLLEARGRDGLVDFLQLEPGCWVPVEPGGAGPSIVDAVAAEHGAPER